MVRITDAKPLPGYRLFLRFTDGSSGEVDLSHLAGKGVFAPWLMPGEFERVSVDREAGTVCWPGDIDLCPDVLYSRATGAPLPAQTRAGDDGPSTDLAA